MKIAYNPEGTVLDTTAPSASDIIFDLNALNIWAKGKLFSNQVFKKYTSSNAGGLDGLVPAPSYTTTTTRYLREDGAWVIPYTFTDNNPTLNWGTKSKVATVGGTDIHVTMPSTINWNKIVTTPTTLTGYGITDAIKKSTNEYYCDLDTVLGTNDVVVVSQFQRIGVNPTTSDNNIGTSRKGVIRMYGNASESQLLLDHNGGNIYSRYYKDATTGWSPWRTVVFNSTSPTFETVTATELHGKIGLLGNSNDSSYPLVFAESKNSSTTSSVAKQLYTNTDTYALTYNPNTNTLSCGTFSGFLSGNAEHATTASTAYTLKHDTRYYDWDTSGTVNQKRHQLKHTYSGVVGSYTYTGLVMDLIDDSPSNSGVNSTYRANLTGIDLDITYKHLGDSSISPIAMARSFTGIDLKATMTDNIMRPTVMSPGIKINWPTTHSNNYFYTPATYISGVTWHESGANIKSLNIISSSVTLDMTCGEFIFLQGSNAYTVTLPQAKTKGTCFYMYKTTDANVTFKPNNTSTSLVFTGKNYAGSSYNYDILDAGAGITVKTKGSLYMVIAHDTGAGGYWSIIQLNYF